jgi:hypothetical protein
MRELLPWKNLARITGAGIGAGAVAFAVKSQLHTRPLILLAVASTAYVVTYIGLVWNFELLQESERSAIAKWARKTTGNIAQVLAYRKET